MKLRKIIDWHKKEFVTAVKRYFSPIKSFRELAKSLKKGGVNEINK